MTSVKTPGLNSALSQETGGLMPYISCMFPVSFLYLSCMLLVSNKLFLKLSFFLLCGLMVIADGRLAIPAGTTRVGPGIFLVWKIELSTRSFLGPGEAPRHFSVKKTITLGFAFCLIYKEGEGSDGP